MIEFSLTLPRFHDVGERVPFRRTYEFAQHVESLGFHAGFVGHHSFTPETKDPAAPFVLLSAIAEDTHYGLLRVGTRYRAGCRNFAAVEDALAHWRPQDTPRARLFVAALENELQFRSQP